MKNLFRLFVVVVFLVAAVSFAATPAATQSTYHEGNVPRPGCAPGEDCVLTPSAHEGNVPRPGCAPGEDCVLTPSVHEGNVPRPGCAPGEDCVLSAAR
jgi:hypothetical protein